MGNQLQSSANGASLRVLDSCAYTWIFDEVRRRFRRVPRGSALDIPYPPGAWAPYDSLELNDTGSSFAVVTSTEGNMVYRCWLHRDPCPRCDRSADGDQALDELRWLVQRWRSRIGVPEGYDRPSSLPARLGSPLVPTRRWGGRGAGQP